MKVDLKINNIQPSYNEPYVVARLVAGELWFYGRYDSMERAEMVVAEFENAIVVEEVQR